MDKTLASCKRGREIEPWHIVFCEFAKFAKLQLAMLRVRLVKRRLVNGGPG